MKHIVYILLLLPLTLFSQNEINGVVFEGNKEKERIPLLGANVYWQGTTVGTTTDENGQFTIKYKNTYTKLIISYVGFKTDTLSIKNSSYVEHWLQPTDNLEEVKINARKKATATSYFEAQNIVTMSSEELLKAACCNLCESFETNPSIDVNFADALTGTRQIKMLGLTSPYILMAIESVPSIRGASQAYGLSFVPGTWVESIQITKGAGSVVNGFESIAGDINAKLQKPVKDSKLFINAYGAGNGRFELNTHINNKISDKLYTGLYLHGNMRDIEFDNNNDSFLDMPLAKQFNVMNRWQYVDLDKGIVSFLNFRYLDDTKQMGQINFNPKTDKFTTQHWGSEVDTKRYDISTKLSYANPDVAHQNIDAQFTYSHHEQASYFGLNVFDITQNSFYSTAIYSSIISDSRHKFKTGLNVTYDDYQETVGIYNNTSEFSRIERSLGAFFEYNYDDLEDLNIIAGIRMDTHNLLGNFITPRLHVRYTPWEKSAFRMSMGRGKRSASIFAENQNIFATSRNVNVIGTGGSIYGLNPEIAWNYGVSFLQGFNLFGRKADVTIDFYRTDFKNQIVVDWENPQEVSFYNLDGKSYSNSFQTEFNINMAEGLDFRFAYKYFDVKTQYTSGKLDKPLTPKNRLFANAAYETHKKSNGSQWKFDATYNWLGEQRFSSTVNNPLQYQLDDYSPTVATLNMQVTKVFSSKFEMYLGGENITNVKQDAPILGADNPFGSNFDTTFVYGPIFGSTYYAGLRFKLN